MDSNEVTRLFALLEPVVIYADNSIDIDELLAARPGGIVRYADRPPVVQYVGPPVDGIAGWISEDV